MSWRTLQPDRCAPFGVGPLLPASSPVIPSKEVTFLCRVHSFALHRQYSNPGDCAGVRTAGNHRGCCRFVPPALAATAMSAAETPASGTGGGAAQGLGGMHLRSGMEYGFWPGQGGRDGRDGERRLCRMGGSGHGLRPGQSVQVDGVRSSKRASGPRADVPRRRRGFAICTPRRVFRWEDGSICCSTGSCP